MRASKPWYTLYFIANVIAPLYSRWVVSNRQVLSSLLMLHVLRVYLVVLELIFFHCLGPPERTNQPSFDETTRYIRMIRTNVPPTNCK